MVRTGGQPVTKGPCCAFLTRSGWNTSGENSRSQIRDRIGSRTIDDHAAMSHSTHAQLKTRHMAKVANADESAGPLNPFDRLTVSSRQDLAILWWIENTRWLGVLILLDRLTVSSKQDLGTLRCSALHFCVHMPFPFSKFIHPIYILDCTL